MTLNGLSGLLFVPTRNSHTWKKGVAAAAVVDDLRRQSCQPKKEQKTTHLTELNNFRKKVNRSDEFGVQI